LAAFLAQADRAVIGGPVDFDTQAAQPRLAARPAAVARLSQISIDETIWMSEAMVAAVRTNDPEAIERLVAAGESVIANHPESGVRLITWAAQHGHTDLVRFLLDRGADIEEKASEAESPLMLAAWQGYPGMVRLLLERGANPYYVTPKGWDVLDFAKMGGDADVVAMLAKLREGKDSYFRRVDYYDDM
jgi:hypothetical protein